jgi:hypothetical protein
MIGLGRQSRYLESVAGIRPADPTLPGISGGVILCKPPLPGISYSDMANPIVGGQTSEIEEFDDGLTWATWTNLN